MITSTDRNVGFGGHITEELREALVAEANKERKSKSQLAFELMREKLIERGYQIPEAK